MKLFATTAISGVKDLVDLSYALRLFAFRGQADASWGLAATIERAFRDSGQTVYSLENSEHWMIDEFQNKYHLYAATPPRKANAFEWLALIQHHGGPTRLLDFTHSIYVAAYFASARASGDSAIWAINMPRLRDNLRSFAKLTYKPGNDLKDTINQHHIDVFNKYVARAKHVSSEDNLMHLVPLESQSLFDRASKQKSLFVGVGYLGGIGKPTTFMDNLRASFPGMSEASQSPEQIELRELCDRPNFDYCYDNFALVKLLVPQAVQPRLRSELAHMGLTEESLFPGLDGLARSLVRTHVMR